MNMCGSVVERRSGNPRVFRFLTRTQRVVFVPHSWQDDKTSSFSTSLTWTRCHVNETLFPKTLSWVVRVSPRFPPSFLFHRLEEVTAQANKFSRLIEQREEQVKGLKTRLEEAVHQNNKLTHAAELKDDKIQSLEKRWASWKTKALSTGDPRRELLKRNL